MSFTDYASKQLEERREGLRTAEEAHQDRVIGKVKPLITAFLDEEFGPEAESLRLGSVSYWTERTGVFFHTECCGAEILTLEGVPTGVSVVARMFPETLVSEAANKPSLHFRRSGILFTGACDISAVTAARKIDKARKRSGR